MPEMNLLVNAAFYYSYNLWIWENAQKAAILFKDQIETMEYRKYRNE
jgi:hypothetical protein